MTPIAVSNLVQTVYIWGANKSLYAHYPYPYPKYLPQNVEKLLSVTYGSVSAGREFWPFRVIFFQKVERSCGQTVKDRFDFSIDSGQLYLVHSGDLNLALEFFLESHHHHHHHHQHHHHHFQKNAPNLDVFLVSPPW